MGFFSDLAPSQYLVLAAGDDALIMKRWVLLHGLNLELLVDAINFQNNLSTVLWMVNPLIHLITSH